MEPSCNYKKYKNNKEKEIIIEPDKKYIIDSTQSDLLSENTVTWQLKYYATRDSKVDDVCDVYYAFDFDKFPIYVLYLGISILGPISGKGVCVGGIEGFQFLPTEN